MSPEYITNLVNNSKLKKTKERKAIIVTYNAHSCNGRQNDPLQPEAQPHLPALSAAGGAVGHGHHFSY